MFAPALLAQSGWFSGDKELEATAWRKSNGDFKAMLFLSTDPQQVYSDWNQGKAPKFSQLKSVRDSQNVEAIILFAGCERSVKPTCDIVGDWIIKVKNGEVLDEVKDSPIYSGPSPVIEDQLLISTNAVGIKASQSDQQYTLIVTLKDRNSERKITLQQSVEVAVE